MNKAMPDEEVRLAALEQLGILDTPPEHEFDQIVALAASMCDMPIATITLVDGTRQWFKAKLGLDIDETPRELSFCSHTIANGGPLIVPDSTRDPRFSNNPLVLFAPHLRFYAGIPLITGPGLAIGTLTVMDHVPRTLTDKQLFALGVLADQAVVCMRLRAIVCELDQNQRRLLAVRSELQGRVLERTQALTASDAARERAEQLYRLLCDTTSDAIVVIDADSKIHFANRGTHVLFGHTSEDLVGGSIASLQPAHVREAHAAGLRRYMASGERHLDWRATESVGLHADGRHIPIEIAFSQFNLEAETLFVGFIRDITGRKRAELALFEEKERAQATLRSIGDGVLVTNALGHISFINPVAERLTGWSASEAVGVPGDQVMQLLDEATGEALANLAGLEPDFGQAIPLLPTAMLRRRDASLISIEGSVARLSNPDGSSAGQVLAFRDVSLARELTARISHQASHDTLTGLVNRGEFDRRLRVALDSAQDGKRQHSMLYLDLDQFKVINDTCGHVAGDQILKQLAMVLGLHLRGSDTLARLGGDEFGVLLENCPASDAVAVADKLRAIVADTAFVWERQSFALTVSIGHVHFDDHSLTIKDVFSRADEACYMAKEQGRNRIHSYRRADQALAQRHTEMEWVQRIRDALAEDRLVLYAQTIYPVHGPNDFSEHVEFLLRMRDREGNLVPPMAFLPAAERYNLMGMLDQWVIRSVFERVAQRVQTGGKPPCYGINVSAASLGDPDFAEFVRLLIDDTGVRPEWLCFEITETVAIANLGSAYALIEELRGIGCRFALDDFGSGMSSFGYLKHLPVDFLKIDGSFVRGIATDKVDRAMVTSINEIGHVMNLRTIAEFVEDDAILEQLRIIGVDYAQGFGLGKPQPFR